MKILKSTLRNKGYGLILALTFVLIMLVLLAGTMNWATSDTQATKRNNQFVNSQYAAEGAVENVIGEINNDFLFNSLTNSSVYASHTPTNISSWPIQYVFSSPNVTNSSNTNQIYVSIGTVATNLTPLTGVYSNLSAFLQECDVAATATPLNQRYNVPATVRESIFATQIPIFQFLIFYNVNLEINAAQTLNARGPVFSNGGFWSGTPNVTFWSAVLSVSNAYNQASDPFCGYTGSGTAVFKVAGMPSSPQTPLTMPVAGVNNTNNSPSVVHKILEWPISAYGLGTANAYTTNGLTYLANEAQLIISNSISGTNWSSLTPHGTNFFVYYQDGTYQSTHLNLNTNMNWASSIIWVTNDFYIMTNTIAHNLLTFSNVVTHSNQLFFTNYVGGFGAGTNVWYAGYSFLTNVLFYDWREGWNGGSGPARPVQAVQFNVTNFNVWLANTNPNGGAYFNNVCKGNTGHSIGGVYIYTSVTNTTTSLPAVRVVKGAQLFDGYGLTIATQFPLYVQGDFNVMDGTGSSAAQNSTTHARPGAVFSDALSFLSNGWSDSTTNVDPSSGTQTTFNAACLSGIVPSNSALGTPSDSSEYSGGVENFFRLLENWSGNSFYYNGSIVVMFPSQYATNRWRQTGNYYGAPSRAWAFDTNFTSKIKLPPMTPDVKVFIRNTWTGH